MNQLTKSNIYKEKKEKKESGKESSKCWRYNFARGFVKSLLKAWCTWKINYILKKSTWPSASHTHTQFALNRFRNQHLILIVIFVCSDVQTKYEYSRTIKRTSVDFFFFHFTRYATSLKLCSVKLMSMLLKWFDVKGLHIIIIQQLQEDDDVMKKKNPCWSFSSLFFFLSVIL